MNQLNKIINHLKINPVKFVHVLGVDGIFSENIIYYMQCNKELFKPNDNLIVVNGYSEDSDKYDNVIYLKNLNKQINFFLENILEYTNHIVIHYLDFNLSLKIPKNVCPKIIWRTWGNDLTYSISYVPGVKLKIKMLYKKLLWNLISKRNVRMFEAVGMSATGSDKITLKKQRINVPTVSMPYPTNYWAEDIMQIVKRPFDRLVKSDNEIWIMIGHSANSSLNHIKYLKKLAHLKNENIRILMPMVYGREDYKNKVKKKAYDIFGNKAIVWTEKLKYDDYLRLLNLIDISIFDAKHQMAMGNISDLLLLGKLVVLNKKGIAYQTLQNNGIKIHDTSIIDNISYKGMESIISKNKPLIAKKYFYNLRTKEAIDKKWSYIYEIFK